MTICDPDRVPADSSADQARALGNQLIEIHQWLRSELARIRDGLGAYVGGDTAQLPAPLRVHCLAFCAALTRHHTSEDATAFPVIGEQFPELKPVLEQLRQDHQLVAGILRTLRQLLTNVTSGIVVHLRRELDGLTAILESHFQWEERRVTDAFNALRVQGPRTSSV